MPEQPTSLNAQDDQQPHDPQLPKRKHISLRRLFLGVFLIVLLLVTCVYVAAFWHEPDPSVDYLAKINAKALAVPEEDRAWPLYRELLIKYDVANMDPLPGYGPMRNPNYKPPSTTTQPAQSPATPSAASKPEPASTASTFDSFDDIWRKQEDTNPEFLTEVNLIPTSDSRWPQAKVELNKYTDLFEAIRQATRKKSLGLVLRHSYAGHDEYLSQQYKRSQPSEMLLEILLPFLSEARKFGRLLSADFHYAVQQQDWPRAMANLHALVGLKEQVNEQGLLLYKLVGSNMITIAHNNIEAVLREQSSELSPELLDQFYVFLQQSSPDIHIDSTEEIRVAKDYLQNLYAPNGRIAYKGILKLTEEGFVLPQVNSISSDRGRAGTVLKLILPWVVATTGSYQQMLDVVESQAKTGEKRAKENPWVLISTPGPAEVFRDKWQSDIRIEYQYWPLHFIGSSSFSDLALLSLWQVRSRAEALQTVIALEKFRRANERYPDTLAELVPAFIAKVPLDIATGGEMLYLIKDGKPVLYSRGSDGDDDKAAEDAYNIGSSLEGDWIIYPF